MAKSGPSQFAHRRTDQLRKKLERAQRRIEREIAANGEVYLGNRGDVSQAELCRRAGVSQATLQNAIHKTTTLPKINAWLNKIAARLGRTSQPAAVPAPAGRSDRSEEYKKVATLYNIAVLEAEHLRELLDSRQAELEEANRQLEHKDRELEQLRIDLAAGKVIRLPKQ